MVLWRILVEIVWSNSTGKFCTTLLTRNFRNGESETQRPTDLPTQIRLGDKELTLMGQQKTYLTVLPNKLNTFGLVKLRALRVYKMF